MEQKNWWKDRKLLSGVVLVVISMILGFYGKVLIIAKFYEPIQVITGLSLWAFSWLLLFVGTLVIGWGTIRMIKERIKNRVKKTIKGTYKHITMRKKNAK